MRVAVSDYDGTLCIGEKVNERTLSAISQWRAAGNMFGIATGRDLSLLLIETGRWKIPYDFLICCNGALVYNHDLTRIMLSDIDDALISGMDVTSKDINKATGILNVLAAKKWPEKEILVIGDDANDLSMILRFNGFTVTTGLDYLKGHAREVFDDVGEMLLKHL